MICSQYHHAQHVSKEKTMQIYTQAIADFIKNAQSHYKIKYDTLYFGNRKNGLPDDFPNIQLPKNISQTEIRLISPEEGTRKQKESTERIYINLIGWVNELSAEFIFVVFSNGFKHQYDCILKYDFISDKKKFVLNNTEFKNPE